jgi:hypothetical protein
MSNSHMAYQPEAHRATLDSQIYGLNLPLPMASQSAAPDFESG